MTIKTPLMNVMTTAARKAGKAILRDFGEVENLQISRKGPADFVTKVDLRAERVVKDELIRTRPHYSFVMEESGVTEGLDKTHRWYVDPLDGTTNFLHGVPHFAVSIALEREGVLVAGVVFNPVTDDMFIAEKGRGAWHNDRRLRVSARRNLKEALISTGIPYHGREGHAAFSSELSLVMNEVAGIRRFGAAALDLAWVAAGRYDAFWERGLGPWDIAAGTVIVREAGGIVSDLAQGQNMLTEGHVLASNSLLHGPMLKVLKGARTSSSAA
ncbi:MAG: inositol monophosphatase [Alphaproteobacteria bacterium]|nr:inositol monophosphatase [Alphaproteobacteria bacterium]